MDKLVIEGGNLLKGSIEVSGAKNAALPVLFATLLCEEPCKLTNVPTIEDISTTVKLLSGLGVKVEHDKKTHTVSTEVKNVSSIEASYDLVRTMRASVLVLGPLLARFGEAKVSLPGGCSIGARPVNLHLMALEKMGAQISLDGGYIHAKAQKLQGAEITFDTVSVGATENTLMAATLAHGKTVIHNAALEPEIVDLAYFLRACGAKISGEGTSTIVVEGVTRLSGCEHSIVADRIEAGTYLCAVGMTGGEIRLPGVKAELVGALLEKLRQCNFKIETTSQDIFLKSDPKSSIKAVDITTLPFPGFATDLQAQFMSLMTISEGSSVITESIFENRFMHVAELTRLGADITIKGPTAIIRGGGRRLLKGATVMATDLRASACLVLAGLAASGTTTVRRMYHLDRGYEKMELKLQSVGANITRQKE